MTYFPLQPRYNVYTDSLGEPLDNGYIYIGETGLDPIANPVKVSWDESGLYPVTFPVRTLNGYPLRDGIPAQMYIEQSHNYEYSILINDEDGDEVFSSSTGLGGYFGEDASSLGGQPASYYAADAEVVHIDGDETLNDEKTFSQSIVVANDFGIRLTNLSGTNRLFLAQDTNDDFLLGSTSAATLVRSDGTFTHNGDIIWTSGNDSALAHLDGTQTFTGVNTFDDDIILTNDTNLYGKDTGGTNRVIARVTSSDVLEFGNILLPVNIRSTTTFTNNGNTIWTSGNDSNIAKLDGTQTFTGVNTFAADVTIDSSTEADIFLDSGDYAYESRIFFRVAGVNRGYIGYTNNATASSESLHFNVGGVSNEVLSIDGAGTLTLPETAETKIELTGATNPLISFSEGAVNKGYIRWMSDGYMRIRNLEDSSEIRVADTPIFSPNGSSLYEIWHEGTFAYEESTFTPVLYGATTAGTGTYTAQYGRYQKVGNWVHFRLYLTWTAHTGTGQMRISGLPYTSEANNCAVILIPNNLTYTGDFPIALVLASSTEIGLYNAATGTSLVNLAMDTSANVAITGSYQAVAA